jgi:hypothetical protein
VPVPDDLHLAAGLILIVIVAIFIALYLSGVPWKIILSNPRTWFQVITTSAVRRSETTFLLVWILFSVAVVLLVTAIIIFIGATAF